MERASPPHFWAENIRHAHIEPCSRDRQNMPYILHLFRFQSSHDLILMTVEFNSHVAEAGVGKKGALYTSLFSDFLMIHTLNPTSGCSAVFYD